MTAEEEEGAMDSKIPIRSYIELNGRPSLMK